MADLGRKIYRYKTVSSTNDLARALANRGVPEGTVVLAKEQTQGRGKWNRSWISPAGEGIWMSLVLKPKINFNDAAQITLMTAVAVIKALNNYLGIKAMVKWPNDVLVNGKKIAGILTEMEGEKGKVKFVIVGVGLNTHLDLNKIPEDLRDCLTSVKHESSYPFSQEKLIKEIIMEMEFYYPLVNQGNFSAIQEEWKSYSATLGKHIKASYQGENIFGQALGLTKSGTLLLRRDSGIVEELSGGDIQIL